MDVSDIETIIKNKSYFLGLSFWLVHGPSEIQYISKGKNNKGLKAQGTR